MILINSFSSTIGKAAVSAAIKTNCVPSVMLDERCEHTIYFKITPKLTGLLNIIGVVGEVVLTAEPTACLQGMLKFETPQVKVKGKQATQMLMDNKLSIKVTQAVPAMSVSFTQLPTKLIAGEILPVVVSLRNSGIVPIEDVFLCCDQPRWLTLTDVDTEVPLSILKCNVFKLALILVIILIVITYALQLLKISRMRSYRKIVSCVVNVYSAC